MCKGAEKHDEKSTLNRREGGNVCVGAHYPSVRLANLTTEICWIALLDNLEITSHGGFGGFGTETWQKKQGGA